MKVEVRTARIDIRFPEDSAQLGDWEKLYYFGGKLIHREVIRTPDPPRPSIMEMEARIIGVSPAERLDSRKGGHSYSGWNEGERVYALLSVDGKEIPVRFTYWKGMGAFAGQEHIEVAPATAVPSLGGFIPRWLIEGFSYDWVREHPWGYEPRPGKKYFEACGACQDCLAPEIREQMRDGCSWENIRENLRIPEKMRMVMVVHDGPGCRVLMEA